MRIVAVALGLFWAMAGCHAQTTVRVLAYPLQNSPAARTLRLFSEELEKRSAGQLRATFASTTDPSAIPYAIRQGQSNIGAASTVTLGSLDPAFHVFELPFLFPDLGAAAKFQSGEGGDVLKQRLKEVGLNSLGFVHEGMWVLASKRGTRDPKDLKGLRLATVAPQYLANQQLRSMGANVVRLSGADVFSALEHGTVEAYAGPFSQFALAAAKGDAKYATVTPMSYLGYVVLADPDWLAKLPEKERSVIQRAATAAEERINQETLENINALSEAIARRSTSVAPLKPQELDEWRAAVQPSWREFDRAIGVPLTKIAAATGGGGDPCPKLAECRCDNRSCKVSCCRRLR